MSAAACATPCSGSRSATSTSRPGSIRDKVIERLDSARIKAVPTGIAHGTVTAVLRDHVDRGDDACAATSPTDGRRATIAYTDDWQEDAARRDFTINALSADPHEPGDIRLFRRRWPISRRAGSASSAIR